MAVEYRVASCSNEIATTIDKCATLDVSSKRIVSELTALKGSITGVTEFEKDETSVRLAGKTHTALVTKRLSLSIDPDSFSDFEEEFVSGKFGEAIKSKININVTPARFPELVSLLDASGFTFTRDFSVNSDVIKDGTCGAEVTNALEGNIKEKESIAVKFEKIEA